MEDGIPSEPGEVAIRGVEVDGVHGHYCYFTCPRKKGLCGVPIKPLSNPPHNNGWNWDGNTDAPTLTPSVNCVGGCGWHGYIRAGKIEGV